MRICHLNKPNQAIRLLHITDTHLFADQKECLLGIPTLESFQAVITEIGAKNIQFDAIIATGDISQDHSSTSYQYFVDGLAHLPQPCYWLPGNHDYQKEMKAVLAQSPLIKCEQVLLGEHWQLILLDSQVKGKPYGWLGDEQLALLEKALCQYPERYALIALHHHPIPAGSKWLDQHQLHNQEIFWSYLERYEQVRGAVCGHIHQDLDRLHLTKRVLAAPSTCIQFLPQSEQFALDPLSPGWREITLYPDGHIFSKVDRLKGNRFIPDMGSSGY